MSEASGNEGSSLVELRSVRKSFGDNVVLDGIDMSIGRGEVVVIAGPSGSGKSTMLRCINGLETVDEGEVRFDGRSVTAAGKGLAKLRAEIGMVFQQFNLFAHKTVMENVTLAPVQVQGISKGEARERAQKLLERVGISAKADAYPADLSGGQQQRVAIARALAMEPTLALAANGTYDLVYTAQSSAFLEQIRGSIDYREDEIVLNIPANNDQAAALLLPSKTLLLAWNAGAHRLAGDAAGFPFAVARNHYAAAAGISEEGLQNSINGQLSIALAQGACP